MRELCQLQLQVIRVPGRFVTSRLEAGIAFGTCDKKVKICFLLRARTFCMQASTFKYKEPDADPRATPYLDANFQ